MQFLKLVLFSRCCPSLAKARKISVRPSPKATKRTKSLSLRHAKKMAKTMEAWVVSKAPKVALTWSLLVGLHLGDLLQGQVHPVLEGKDGTLFNLELNLWPCHFVLTRNFKNEDLLRRFYSSGIFKIGGKFKLIYIFNAFHNWREIYVWLFLIKFQN